jgi:GT2 family glycosyltransferase
MKGSAPNMVDNSPTNTPLVYIILLSFNGAHHLEVSLASLLASDYPNFRILVVDNRSHDHSAALVRRKFPEVELIENEKNYGFAGGMNIGIRRAMAHQADYVLLVNQDTSFDRECLSQLVTGALTSSRIGLAVPMLFEYGTNHLAEAFINWLKGNLGAGAQNPEKLAANPVHDVRDVAGAAMLISRKTLEAVGLFDPFYFAYSEESDLCRRLLFHDFRIVLCPRARFWHKTLFTSLKKKLIDRARLIFALKNPHQNFFYNFCSMMMLLIWFLERGLGRRDYSYVIFMSWSFYDIMKHIKLIYLRLQAEKKKFNHNRLIPQRPYDVAAVARMLFGNEQPHCR